VVKGFFLQQVTTPKQLERAKKYRKKNLPVKRNAKGKPKRKMSVTRKSKEENSLAPKEKEKEPVSLNEGTG
jgi:hypothetical protein